ncbi:hypothetical protein [Tenacibaculum ovolyticum]|uniref:hypothetical protein n=1 Tax=Tenacibaculum ovolyticum TaxID=104270 RepID=UPI0007EC3B54|nr:hypothetical protein [Tenacibaculum ovolyticum]
MKKYIILTTLILFINCKVRVPIVKLTTSDKYQVVLRNSEKLKGFWAIQFPFEIEITNDSYRDRGFTHYKHYCSPSSKCSNARLYLIDNDKLIKQSIGQIKKIGVYSKKKYVIYSEHYIDTLKYPRSFFKEYYQKLKESSFKDSLPVGTLAKFKKKHPKMVAHLLKNDSIYFSFPRLDNGNKFEGPTVPVVY